MLELWLAVSPLVSAIFAAGGAYGAITWRFRALEWRVAAVEKRTELAHERVDQLLTGRV